jgi:hypothetical protein
MKRFIPITVLFGLFLLPSCKDKDCYQVNGILDPYLQLFLKEAEKRNLHFDVEEDGLILEFADLDEPTIGLCTYSDPLLVQIDQEYWRNVEEYENCEDLRENVVFHELAHGLLNRRHDNEVMANKEWASLMCGGDEVEGRSWQVNFSGERRDYYLDELFNPATPHPKWGEYGERFSGEKGAKINELNLSSDKYEVDGDGNIFQIKDGVYHISLNSHSNTLLPMWKNLNLSGDFYYEIALKGDLSDDKKCMGVGVGLKNGDDVSYTTFIVYYNSTYKSFRAAAANDRCLTPLAEVLLEKEVADFNDFNVFAIERKADRIRFYLNQQLIYVLDRDADKVFSDISFIVPGESKTSIQLAGVYGQSSSVKSGVLDNSELISNMRDSKPIGIPNYPYVK